MEYRVLIMHMLRKEVEDDQFTQTLRKVAVKFLSMIIKCKYQ